VTDDDYRAALREASALFDDLPDPGTERGDDFKALVTRIEAYEAKVFGSFFETRVDAPRRDQT
jgi:HTH-type transcriptional regulator/antitoxin HigA